MLNTTIYQENASQMRYHFTPVRIVFIKKEKKKPENTSNGEVM